METSSPKWIENRNNDCWGNTHLPVAVCRHNNMVGQIVRGNGGYVIYIMSDSEYEKACKNLSHTFLYNGFEWVYEKAIAVASKRLIDGYAQIQLNV